MMSIDEGLAKGVALLKEVIIRRAAGRDVLGVRRDACCVKPEFFAKN